MNSYGEEESIFHCDGYSESDCNIFEQHAKECSKNLPPWMKKELENTTGLEYQYSFEEDYDLVNNYFNKCPVLLHCSIGNCIAHKISDTCLPCLSILKSKSQIHETAKLIRESNNG